MTDKITIEREKFELWWESFKDEHDEWRFADREAILFAAWKAAPPAPAAVPLTDDQLRADLISCRGTVKTELNHYERLAIVHGKTMVAENYNREAQRLSDLLERIDALIAAAAGEKP